MCHATNQLLGWQLRFSSCYPLVPYTQYVLSARGGNAQTWGGGCLWYIFLSISKAERQRVSQRDDLLAGLLPRELQHAGLGQAEVRSQLLVAGLLCGCGT